MIISMMMSMMQMQQNQKMHQDNMSKVGELNQDLKEQGSDFKKELARLGDKNTAQEKQLEELKKLLGLGDQNGGQEGANQCGNDGQCGNNGGLGGPQGSNGLGGPQGSNGLGGLDVGDIEINIYMDDNKGAPKTDDLRFH